MDFPASLALFLQGLQDLVGLSKILTCNKAANSSCKLIIYPPKEENLVSLYKNSI